MSWQRHGKNIRPDVIAILVKLLRLYVVLLLLCLLFFLSFLVSFVYMNWYVSRWELVSMHLHKRPLSLPSFWWILGQSWTSVRRSIKQVLQSQREGQGPLPLNPEPYSPPQVARIWLWVYHQKIPLYPIFYLRKGDYTWLRLVRPC